MDTVELLKVVAAILGGAVGAWGGVRLQDWRLKQLERRVGSLEESVRGEDGIQVQVALLRGR